MKSILLSIRPKWCELIASGKKTIEVRKTKPKISTPFKVYIYCTNDFYRAGDGYLQGKYCGKVIGEFVCDEIELLNERDLFKGGDEISNSRIEEYSCLNIDELLQYKKDKEEIYAFHISDLVIYDKPKELKRFGRFECEYCGSKKECFAPETIYDCSLQRIDTHLNNNNMYRCDGDFLSLKRPPQSWCYVEELK